MEQIDRISIISQIFWLIICFLCLYFIVLFYSIPKIHRVLRLRIYLFNIDFYKIVNLIILLDLFYNFFIINNQLILNLKYNNCILNSILIDYYRIIDGL